MKKIPIKDDPSKYITTSKARELAGKNASLEGIQKYSVRGSRKTYYYIEDIRKIADISENKPSEEETAKEKTQDEKKEETKLFLEAYVDGSFNKETGVYGSAVIMVNEGEVIAVKTSNGRKMNAMRNVAGEISAAALAIKMAEEFLADALIIKYDYEGIEKWATGAWRAKNEYTQQYAAFMNRKRAFKLSFEHVKAHTGDKYNELADDMAIRAAGLKPEYTEESSIKEEKIPEDILRMKYQVKDSCLKSIKEFYSKEKHAFKDYISIKAGTGDNFSKWWNIDDYKEIVSESAISYICGKFSDNTDIVNALRWTARGLDPQDAVKKVNVNNEIYAKKG